MKCQSCFLGSIYCEKGGCCEQDSIARDLDQTITFTNRVRYTGRQSSRQTFQQGESNDMVRCGSDRCSVHGQASEDQADNPKGRRQKRVPLNRQRLATLVKQHTQKKRWNARDTGKKQRRTCSEIHTD